MTSGIHAICDALTEFGVECVFGVPGTQNVPLFEALRQRRIRTVLASHELAAGFMANGYFRATGRIAALATIPGPGLTYAVTALAEAAHDSVPLLYLVGKPATSPGRRFQLQAIDQRAVLAPIVKGSFCIDSPSDARRLMREAHAMAIGGEPGPVMIELDLRALEDEEGVEPTQPAPASPMSCASGMERLSSLFAASERPVLLLGQGAFGEADRLRQMAETLTIPVVTTPTARGIVREDHPMAMGFDPLRGHVDKVNDLLDRSDLILGLGCKLGHNGSAGFQLRLPADRFVHVDRSPEVLGANYEPLLALTASVEDALHALEQRTSPTRWGSVELALVKTALRVRTGEPEPSIAAGSTSITPGDFFGWLRGVLPLDAIVVTDSGLHQILTRRHLDVLSPRGLICPTDFQSMGFGLAAAIGAKLAAPKRLVVAVIGDGGFLMSGLEMLTARREGASIAVIVFNDGKLNQIRLQQWAQTGYAHSVNLLNPDFEALAGALGVAYVAFGESGTGGIERALASPEPVLVEVLVGDSLEMRRAQLVATTKAVARTYLKPEILGWVKTRLGRGSSGGTNADK